MRACPTCGFRTDEALTACPACQGPLASGLRCQLCGVLMPAGTASCPGCGDLMARQPQPAVPRRRSELERRVLLALVQPVALKAYALLALCPLIGMAAILLRPWGGPPLPAPLEFCAALGFILADTTFFMIFLGPLLLGVALFKRPRLTYAGLGVACLGWGWLCIQVVARVMSGR